MQKYYLYQTFIYDQHLSAKSSGQTISRKPNANTHFLQVQIIFFLFLFFGALQRPINQPRL
jgi:hypothetical protein